MDQGRVDQPGPGTVWMRPEVGLLDGETMSPPEGDWVCLDAETTLGGGSVGMATSAVYDARGLVARSSQALLITKR